MKWPAYPVHLSDTIKDKILASFLLNMNLLQKQQKKNLEFHEDYSESSKMASALWSLDLNVSNLKLALWTQCLYPAAGSYYFRDFFFFMLKLAISLYAWFTKQNSLFTVQCPSADMRGHSEMHLERSMGTGLNEQHAVVHECKMCLLQKESRALRAPVEMVTQGSRLLECIWKYKDCIWLGNFVCTKELGV